MADREPPLPRDAYRWIVPITTRWADNDAYGHVNNVVYYAWFDTVVNSFLIENGLLDPLSSEAIGLVVETGCRYFESLSFPEPVEAGLRLARLGNSSVEYRIGVFAKGRDIPAAEGRFVHVYVASDTRRPVPVPLRTRELLQARLG